MYIPREHILVLKYLYIKYTYFEVHTYRYFLRISLWTSLSQSKKLAVLKYEHTIEEGRRGHDQVLEKRAHLTPYICTPVYAYLGVINLS